MISRIFRTGGGRLLALAALAPLIVTGLAASAQAKILKYAGAVEITMLEPHYVAYSEMTGFMQNIYEPLTSIDATGKVYGKLATEWKQIEPTRWRFSLRKGVKFHEGQDLTADDVVFSYQRSMSPTAFGLRTSLSRVKEFVKVDDYTFDVVTNVVDVILPRELNSLHIASKKWATDNNTVVPADRTVNAEGYATRHANGTGPFMVVNYDQGISVELKVNENWWGGKRTDGLTGAKYFMIKNPSTMVAGLLSGELDMIVGLVPPLIDNVKARPGIVVKTGRAAVTLNVGFDVNRDELLFSSVKGKNPFKDQRVRDAVSLVIDGQAISDKIFRGYAFPNDLIFSEDYTGYDPELAKPAPVDVPKAKRLMAEAGYPDGFSVDFDCPSQIYLNDEQICQAIVIMVAQIGIKARAVISPSATFGERIGSRPPGSPAKASFRMNGSLSGTLDSLLTATSYFRTFEKGKLAGANNVNGYSNPEIDALIDAATSELDDAKREEMIKKIWTIIKRDRPLFGLLQPPVIWAMNEKVDATPNSLNRVSLSTIKMK